MLKIPLWFLIVLRVGSNVSQTHISDANHLSSLLSPPPPLHLTLQMFSAIFSSPNKPYSTFWRVRTCCSLYIIFSSKALFISQVSDVRLCPPIPGNVSLTFQVWIRDTSRCLSGALYSPFKNKLILYCSSFSTFLICILSSKGQESCFVLSHT